MGYLSLESGVVGSLSFSWNWGNYSDALSLYDTQFARSFLYSGAATLICLLVAYPLAYTIAFRAGRWRNALLFAVVAPFFTTYLIRTLAWETILSDQSPVVDALRISRPGARERPRAGDRRRRDRRPHLQLPALHDPADLRQPRADRRAADRGGQGPLRILSGRPSLRVTLPLSAPGIVAGTLLTFIPATGDYVNAQFLGSAGNQMIGNVIQSLYKTQLDYPAAAALSFVLMAMIMVVVLIYIRFAGSEALMGEDKL